MAQKRNKSVMVEETVNNLRRLFQVVKQSKTVVSENGLTGPQLWAIKVLFDETDDAMTVSKLATLMFLDASTVVRILNGLEEKLFIQRIRSTFDRRVVYVNLTEHGRLLMNGSPSVAHNLLMNGLNTLSDNKLNTIAIGLSQLVNILDSRDLYVAKNILSDYA